MNGKDTTKKTCESCRYFIKRALGTYNQGFAYSMWGYCEGNKGLDLTGKGKLDRLGMTRANLPCQLPNVGKPADWKPRFHTPMSFKKQRFYDSHPAAFNPHYDGNKRWRRQREYALERMRELENG